MDCSSSVCNFTLPSEKNLPQEKAPYASGHFQGTLLIRCLSSLNESQTFKIILDLCEPYRHNYVW